MDNDAKAEQETPDERLNQSEISEEIEKKKVKITAIENKIAETETKLQKLQNEQKALEHRLQLKANRDKYKERKARTHRLIEMGELTEKYLDIHIVDELEMWLKKHVSQEQNKHGTS